MFHYLLYKFFVATIDARTRLTLGACRRVSRLNLFLPPPPPCPLTPPPLLHVYRKLSRSLARAFTLSHLSLTAAHPLLPFVSLYHLPPYHARQESTSKTEMITAILQPHHCILPLPAVRVDAELSWTKGCGPNRYSSSSEAFAFSLKAATRSALKFDLLRRRAA